MSNVVIVGTQWGDEGKGKIVDLLSSSADLVVRRTKEGFGLFTNLGIGLVGALIGGFIFKALHINLKLGKISVSLEDLLSAFIGSLIFLGVVWFFKRRWNT